jgi:hypothetical protein
MSKNHKFIYDDDDIHLVYNYGDDDLLFALKTKRDRNSSIIAIPVEVFLRLSNVAGLVEDYITEQLS